MPEEFHVSSLIVHGAAELLPAISAAVAVLPGAEVHASDGIGKLIVTLETVHEAEISERIDAIRALDGVFAASLVYHQVEDADAEEAEPVS
jgi:nitrate reductase NapD